MSFGSEFWHDTEDPHGRGQILSDWGGLVGDGFSRDGEGRSIVGNFGLAILGGAYGGGGEAAGGEGAAGGMAGGEGGASPGFEGFGKFSQSAMPYLQQIMSGFGGGGQQQQQQPRMNPFSPANPLSQDSPYHPTQFQNASFTPWEQNIATMGMPIQQKPMQHIFGQGNRLF